MQILQTLHNSCESHTAFAVKFKTSPPPKKKRKRKNKEKSEENQVLPSYVVKIMTPLYLLEVHFKSLINVVICSLIFREPLTRIE